MSNVYLHYVLDLWFERVVKPRLAGRSPVGALYRRLCDLLPISEDALRVQDALRHRLGKFGLTLEPTKTKLVEFGRFAQRHAGKRGRKRPETIYFLGLTLYCTRNRKGNFKVGMRTEKSRLRRSLMSLQELMRQIRHQTIRNRSTRSIALLRGHYAYYGVAGNIRALQRVYRLVERYWRRMLRSRSWAGRRLTWAAFNQIKERIPLLRPNCGCPTGRCRLSQCCEPTPEERSAGNPHATFCGSRRRATASGDPVGVQQWASLPRMRDAGRQGEGVCGLVRWLIRPVMSQSGRSSALLDNLVGAGKQCWRHGEPERLRSLKVDHEVEFCRLLNQPE